MAARTAKPAVVTVATIEMVLDKETKNTVRFAAVTEDAPVPYFYVAKTAFEDGKYPLGITVTITA